MKVKLNSVEFQVNQKFNPTFWEYFSSGLWEPLTFDIIDQFVSKGNVVLDIGSWIGPLTLYLAGNGVQVISIEPDPVAFNELESNIKLNPDLSDHICAYKCAIVPKSKAIKLYARNSHGDSSSSILSRSGDTQDFVNVDGIRLEQFVSIAKPKQIDFIKMDIEGGEFEVLPDIIPVIEMFDMPTIFVSFHYSYLNEYFYNQHFILRHVSTVFRKLEKILNYNLFGAKMLASMDGVLVLAQKYRYIYTEYGEEINLNELEPSQMIQNEVNLVFTNKKWAKS